MRRSQRDFTLQACRAAGILRVVVVAVLALSCCHAALAQTFGLQSHISRENAQIEVPRPIDPRDPDGGWMWPGSSWSLAGHAVQDGNVITSTFDATVTISRENAWRRFGMDNRFVEDNFKTFTLAFTYKGGKPEVIEDGGSRGGIHPAHDGPVVKSELISTSDDGRRFIVKYRFTPQPDWEFITIRNRDAINPLEMSNIKFTTVCRPVPGPGAGALALVGVVVCLARRRRG